MNCLSLGLLLGGWQSPRPQDARGQPDNLRSRWAAVSSRCRESLSKTTRELKGRWAGGTHRSSGEGETLQPFAGHAPADAADGPGGPNTNSALSR